MIEKDSLTFLQEDVLKTSQNLTFQRHSNINLHINVYVLIVSQSMESRPPFLTDLGWPMRSRV